MALTLVSPPTAEPLTLAEVKAHLRIDHADEDAMLAIYIRAAREFCDGPSGFLGRALVTQTWKLTLDAFPTSEIKIPLPPLQSVDTVKYYDAAGVQQTVANTDYYVDVASEPGWVKPVTGVAWPTTLDGINAVEIQFVAGYAPSTNSPAEPASNIPFNIKAAILLMIGNMYENREDNVAGVVVNKVPNGAEYLLRRHKFDLSMA